MNTLVKNPTRSSRPTSWLNPVDRFFHSDFLDLWYGNNLNSIPSMNISEEKDNYKVEKVELAAPGLKKDDFNINVEGNLVTISCDKETETKESKDKNGYSSTEYNYSCFSRSFMLPDFADTNKITAKYNDGVLNLSISKKPKAQQSMSPKIKVQ